MVRRLLLVALVAQTCAPPAAVAADWSRAGGGLFVDTQPSPTEAASEDTPRLSRPDQPFDPLVQAAAARYGLDPKLLHSLIIVESGYRPGAVSQAGAAGLTQLMPATAEALGVEDRLDPAANVAAGAAYLARQVTRFGDIRLALAAYNAGPARVAKLGRTPQITETQAYVRDVVDCYLALSAGRSVRSARECQTRGGRHE